MLNAIWNVCEFRRKFVSKWICFHWPLRFLTTLLKNNKNSKELKMSSMQSHVCGLMNHNCYRTQWMGLWLHWPNWPSRVNANVGPFMRLKTLTGIYNCFSRIWEISSVIILLSVFLAGIAAIIVIIVKDVRMSCLLLTCPLY